MIFPMTTIQLIFSRPRTYITECYELRQKLLEFLGQLGESFKNQLGFYKSKQYTQEHTTHQPAMWIPE